MDDKTRELIAIGVSIGAHCQPCLAYHVSKAREIGIEEDGIRAAIEIGHKVEKGSMVAMKEFTKKILEESGDAIGK